MYIWHNPNKSPGEYAPRGFRPPSRKAPGDRSAGDIGYAIKFGIDYINDTKNRMDKIERDLDRLSKLLDEIEKRRGTAK